MNGNTNAQNVLRKPSWAIIRYIGTTVTVPGTINVAIVTLVAALFYIHGPSVGLTVFSVLLVLAGLMITVVAAMRS